MQPPTPIVPIDELIVEASVYTFFGLTDEGRLGYTDVSDPIAHKAPAL